MATRGHEPALNLDRPVPAMPGAHLVARTPGGRLLCVFPVGGMHFFRSVVTLGVAPSRQPEFDTWEELKFHDHTWEFNDLAAAMDAVLDWDGEPESLTGWLRHNGPDYQVPNPA